MEKIYLSDLLRDYERIFLFEPYHDSLFDRILDEEKKRLKISCPIEIYAPQPLEQYNAKEIMGFIDSFDGEYRINLEFPSEIYFEDTKKFTYVISKCVKKIRRHNLKKEHPVKSLLYKIGDWLMEPILWT